MSREDPDFIDSVEKAFRLLQVFSRENPSVTITKAAQLTGLSRPTARRLLLTLVRLGYAEATEREFKLTPRVLRLGHGYLSTLPLWESALPHMRALSDRVLESSSLATLEGTDIIYLARVPSARSMTVTFNIGSRLPAYATSMGRVLLADLDSESLDAVLEATDLIAMTEHTITDPTELRAELQTVRDRGWATVDGEREIGVRSAAAPIRDATRRAIAAINVSANAARVDERTMIDDFVPEILKAASEISADLGYVERP